MWTRKGVWVPGQDVTAGVDDRVRNGNEEVEVDLKGVDEEEEEEEEENGIRVSIDEHFGVS